MNCTVFPNKQIRIILRILQRRQLTLYAACASSLNRTTCDLNRGYKNLFKNQIHNVTAVCDTKRFYCQTNVPVEHSDTILPTKSSYLDVFVDLDSDLTNTMLKALIYPNPDVLQNKLNHCQSEQELLEELLQQKHEFKSRHYVQSILILWTLFKNTRCLPNNQVYFMNLMSHILEGLQKYIPNLNEIELSCSYLYLRKLGAENTHTTMRELLCNSLENVKFARAPIPLCALSRLVVGINTGREFHVPTVCQHFMWHINAHLQNCVTEEDVRLLSICFLNLHALVTKDMLDKFKSKVREMLLIGTLNSTTVKSLLKLTNMLNMSIWSQQNSVLIRDIMHMLHTSIPQMNENEIKFLCRAFHHHHEPASVADPLMKATEKLPSTNISAFACFMPFAELKKREELTKLFRKMVVVRENWSDYNASSNFFTILRGLKIADVKLCDLYWSTVLEQIQQERNEDLVFLRHCHRYMNFNNNLGGTYRYTPLERHLSQLSMDAIENSINGRLPNKFARLAAFVIAYGHTELCWKKFPNVIISKILSMAEQFTINDCLLLSRGIQIASELRFRFYIPTLLDLQLDTITNVLTACAERHLSKEDKLTVPELNTIVRSLGSYKKLKNSVTYHNALNKYKEVDLSDLNSRLIRDITINLTTSNFIIPELLDAMCNYVEKNYEYVTADTVEKLLTCCYHLGYTPKTLTLFEYAASMLMRDFEHMSGISIVQTCLALCFYKAIPEQLINRVFCVKFIQRIENEIQMCYSKATYPERVLNLVMQLNRTVCLDFPEANVPWFQQNYLEAHLSRKQPIQSNFSEDVRELLKKLLKDNKYLRCNHITPYGYQTLLYILIRTSNSYQHRLSPHYWIV
ncbi:FAST kinase domain-containing protein 1, mitochondrial isoform X2 [Teleopsis dalmanni]|uniref:FAST kinase domain-containing protein 1, mitochondrial isoform X2 n=1 Tax=Teleopsis dalmanni TaxID=139649 RepID=UPI0018CF47C1|nr:FAST kinase domain-containing protein 1, mitochondrial isoform X2 [Teleopsis dalmanni]